MIKWISEKLLKFLANFKSQRSDDVLITKELIFRLPNFGFLNKFSAFLESYV